jgi:ferredoxin
MDYTRRDLFKKMFNPTRWAGSSDEPATAVFPPGQDIVLRVDDCIAWGRGVCDKCEPVCETNAIIFVGMLHPRIIPDRCTLCGDCVPVCPTAAIAIRPGSQPDARPEAQPEAGESS